MRCLFVFFLGGKNGNANKHLAMETDLGGIAEGKKALGLREVEGNMGGDVFIEKDYTFSCNCIQTEYTFFPIP
jgi:hypothetical protein